jgi:hypothetical protein
MNELEFKILLNEKLCDLAEAILHYYNPCKFNGNSCLLSDKIGKETNSCCFRSKFDRSNEDKVCLFLKGRSCGFRNIGCKLFLCYFAAQENLECVEDLKSLELIAKHYGLMRRPFLGDRYAGMTEELIRIEDKELNNG